MSELLTQLQPLLDLVGLKVETVMACATYLLTLQIVLKLVASWITKKILTAITLAKSTEETTDDAAILRLLNNTWYKRAAFMLDVLLRIKLPRSSDFLNPVIPVS